jgi:hypothetical protein
MIKFFLWFITLVTACALAGAFWMGAVQPVVITERTDGPFLLVYREMSDLDLSKIGDITTELDRLLRDAGVDQRRPLDVFFPDDHIEVGFSVAGVTKAKLDSLAGKPKVREIAKQDFMFARFPYRNRSSYVLGFMKVDPALTKYRDAHGYKKVEAMAVNDGSEITYMQPVVKEK